MWSSLQHVLLFGLAGVNAMPHIQKRDITASQLTTFELFAEYAGAAYCFNNVNSPAGKKLSCTANGGFCPQIESSQTSILSSFIAGGTRTTGYLAVDDTHKLIVVSIQGTAFQANPIDVLTDIDIIRVKTNICGTANKNDGCEIHQGFYNAVTDTLNAIKQPLASAQAAHPDYQVISTGHSLGAAVAALLGATLRNSGTNVNIYTYGQPHVGTADISNYIQSQAPAKGNNFRITNWNDDIPQLPPHDLGNWDHFYPEFWIDIPSGVVAPANVKVVNGNLYSTAGNEGATTGEGLIADVITGSPAHGNYFGNIAQCSPEAP